MDDFDVDALFAFRANEVAYVTLSLRSSAGDNCIALEIGIASRIFNWCAVQVNTFFAVFDAINFALTKQV